MTPISTSPRSHDGRPSQPCRMLAPAMASTGTTIIQKYQYSQPATNPAHGPRPARSEEHTSELQSQSNLVCRLLLEKKNMPASRAVACRRIGADPKEQRRHDRPEHPVHTAGAPAGGETRETRTRALHHRGSGRPRPS